MVRDVLSIRVTRWSDVSTSHQPAPVTTETPVPSMITARMAIVCPGPAKTAMREIPMCVLQVRVLPMVGVAHSSRFRGPKPVTMEMPAPTTICAHPDNAKGPRFRVKTETYAPTTHVLKRWVVCKIPTRKGVMTTTRARSTTYVRTRCAPAPVRVATTAKPAQPTHAIPKTTAASLLKPPVQIVKTATNVL